MTGRPRTFAQLADSEAASSTFVDVPLPPDKTSPGDTPCDRPCVRAELPRLLGLALPSMAVQVNVFALWALNAAFAGSVLGTPQLAAVSLANLAGNLSALSVLLGLVFVLDTLAPQAIGAGRLADVGVLAQRCTLVCLAALLPGYIVWFNMEALLRLAGQAPAVSALAARFLRIYAAGLPGYVLFEIVRRFLGCQDVVWPIAGCTGFVAWIVHPLLLRGLHGLGLGFDTVPMASVVSMWLFPALSIVYARVARPHRPGTWEGLDLRRALDPKGVREFLALGVPGVFSMSEWWFWEVNAFAAGILGEVALAAHAIAYSLVPLLVMIPLGVSVAISVRIGCMLGEGRPRSAQRAALVATAVGMLPVLSYTAATAGAGEAVVGLFAPADRSPDVHAAAMEVWPLVCFFLTQDGLFMLQTGTLRALGLQLRLSLAVAASLWALGLPLALTLAFRAEMGLRGLWTALGPAYVALNGALFVSYASVDWAAISRAARREGAAEVAGEGDIGLAAIPEEAAEGPPLLRNKSRRGSDGVIELAMDERCLPAAAPDRASWRLDETGRPLPPESPAARLPDGDGHGDFAADTAAQGAHSAAVAGSGASRSPAYA